MTDSGMPAAGTAPLTPLQRAFIALEDTRARLAAAEQAANEPIAVIGLGCRVPGGGNDPASFWSLMRDGKDAIGPIPADRWDVDATFDPDPDTPGRIATRAGGFIEDVRGFDPAVFGIARREAQGMDPQQRLLLEVAWEALEHAAQPPNRLERTSTGIYVGVTGSDYAYLQLEGRDRELLDAHFTSGIAHSIVSGRVSYLLGLQGPALTIDTACSSSLVAVHLACQGLRTGDCRMALAGGVNLILSPDLYIALSRSRMLAPDGRCKTFDALADGFARGEGCGVVVLKRLSDAQADGDRVLALIRGSAVNQDGPSSGLTAPNGPAQEAVIRAALARAGVAPSLVGYVEAHGTGTQLGDPLEVAALGAVFGPDRDPTRPLLIGSVKTNIGHLEAAAGVTGLIKLVLSLRHGEIPRHLHFHEPSPHIPWDEFPVQVPTRHMPWVPIEGRRLAGVSSFGFSGTNAHVVVEEAPAVPAAGPDRSAAPRVFLLSGRSEAALAAMAGRYAAALSDVPAESLDDVCYSAAAGRAHFPHRAAIDADSMVGLRERLTALSEGRAVDGVRTGKVQRRDPARVAFLYTGQGAQYAGMACRLDDTQPVFRAAIDRCAEVLDRILPGGLRAALRAPADSSPLDQTAFTQPVLFAVEYALGELWKSWGLEPDVVIGHSVGEYPAAVVAGVLGLEDALALVAERGKLMQSLPPGGAMAAIFAAESDVLKALAPWSGEASIAAQNGPVQTVVAGSVSAVDAVCTVFGARGVRCQRLPVSHAFHSPLVDPILEAFAARVGQAALRPPTRRMISNLTGTLADAGDIVRPEYWRRHVRETVRFADGMRTLLSLRPDVCVEIGPHPTLLAFASATLDAVAPEHRPVLVASLRKGRPDDQQIAEALGALYLAGVDLDWRAVWSAASPRWVDLPAYAFQREPLWFPQRAAASVGAGRDTGHPLLGWRLRSAVRDTVQFEVVMDAGSQPFLADHVVADAPVLPATAFLEMARAAGLEVLRQPVAVRDMVILAPLRFAPDERRAVQVVVRRVAAGMECEVLSSAVGAAADEWLRHAECRLLPVAATAAAETLDAIRGRCTVERAAEEHYADLAARGLTFGPSLRGVRSILCGENEALSEVQLPDPSIAGRGSYGCHPALLDACVQTLSAALISSPLAAGAAGRAYLPLAIESCLVLRSPTGDVWSHATVTAAEGATPGGTLSGTVTGYDAEGPFVHLTGIALRPAPTGVASGAADGLVEVVWESLPAGDSNWLSPPAAVRDACAGRLAALAAEHDLESYQRAFVDLEALSTDWIHLAFAELGWSPAAGDLADVPSLASRLGVILRYHGLLSRLLGVLAEDGWLRAEGSGWRVVKPLPKPSRPDLDARIQALRTRHPTSLARLDLAARCGPDLGRILTGDVDPLHRLFPGGSAELAESLYRDAPEARAYNQLLRDALLVMTAELPPGRPRRILEIGGGTGGTTAWVAPTLPADRTEYVFTDIGPSMVVRARQKFAEHGFMTFQTLDLDRPVGEQGLEGREFDVVLAANVIHATSDLRRTLGALRGLLAPGGTLLMLEVAGLERWIDITFGLTEGWWAFTDHDVRRDYPLLDVAGWLALLEAEGFDAAAVAAPDARSREALLAARSRGGSRPAGRWLVVGGGEFADAVVAELTSAGCQAASTGTPAADEDRIRSLVAGDAGGLQGVVHVAAVGTPTSGAIGSMLPVHRGVLGSFTATVQGLGSASYAVGRAPQLWVVTQGAVVTPASADSPAPVQASLTGLARVAAMEHPEFGSRRIDLDPRLPAEGQAAAAVAEILSAGREEQLALRGGNRWGARLAPATVSGPPDPVQLIKGPGGVFDELQLARVPRRPPGPGEVEIRVVAGGLNFRDVMNAVAMRDDPEPLGGECAGRISAVGPGVTDVAVGDHVVAIAEASFATYATTSASLVRPIPAGLSFADAATLPFAFMTAQHALFTAGDLQRGERVLIHAGAGGVGMAAIQLALEAGAVVFATAGSETKRAFLRSIGAAHVFDSRTVGFEEEIARVTAGRGVDVVLNSLAGEFIEASVGSLAQRGRFLEIGKRDIWTPERFADVRPEGRYAAIDLAAMRLDDPAGTAALFGQVIDGVRRGRLRPLPVSLFPMERAADAFRFMAMGRHTGKVVLVQPDPAAGSLAALNPEATYLVTGGLGGLGLLTAGRLVERGARHLVLVGRRAPTPENGKVLDTLRAVGAEITVVQADVSSPAAVEDLIRRIPAARPLRGIVHSAGVLEDGALLQHSWESFVKPLGPKVEGTWALHEVTRGMRLDFFVMYSSMASVIGSSGQGNHAAANAFMDALAWSRQAAGEPALSISWGPWSEVGAAADRNVDTRIAAQGIDAIRPDQGLNLLERLMEGGRPHVGVFPARWSEFLAASGPARPFFQRMRRADGVGRRAPGPSVPVSAAPDDIVRRIREASPARRHDLLLSAVGDQVARVIGATDAGAIDPRQPLNELGLDSLMAVELRNRLGTMLGLTRSLPATLVFDHPTLDAVVRYLERDVLELPEGTPPGNGAPAPTGSADAVLAIDELSDEAIEAMFAKRVRGS